MNPSNGNAFVVVVNDILGGAQFAVRREARNE